MTRKAIDSGNKRGASNDTWAKVKYDRQIVAIAKVCGATTIYSDDDGIAALGKEANIQVVKLWELPLPPDKAQIEMKLEQVAQDESPKEDETPEAG
jgi:hypothetical protein